MRKTRKREMRHSGVHEGSQAKKGRIEELGDGSVWGERGGWDESCGPGAPPPSTCSSTLLGRGRTRLLRTNKIGYDEGSGIIRQIAS